MRDNDPNNKRGVMKTSELKELLEIYDIPTDSWIEATDQVSDEKNVYEEDYIRRTEELIGVTPSFEDSRKYRYLYIYCIQEGVRAIVNGDVEIDLNVVAHDRMETFFVRCNWVLHDFGTSDKKVDKYGKPKPKRGAKKELAKALYQKHKDEDLTRKQWIELLVKDADMTKAGASTYYSGLKKGTL